MTIESIQFLANYFDSIIQFCLGLAAIRVAKTHDDSLNSESSFKLSSVQIRGLGVILILASIATAASTYMRLRPPSGSEVAQLVAQSVSQRLPIKYDETFTLERATSKGPRLILTYRLLRNKMEQNEIDSIAQKTTSNLITHWCSVKGTSTAMQSGMTIKALVLTLNDQLILSTEIGQAQCAALPL